MVTEYRTLSRAEVPSEWREKRCDCCGKLFVACGSEWSSPRYCSPRCVGEAAYQQVRGLWYFFPASALDAALLLGALSGRRSP